MNQQNGVLTNRKRKIAQHKEIQAGNQGKQDLLYRIHRQQLG